MGQNSSQGFAAPSRKDFGAWKATSSPGNAPHMRFADWSNKQMGAANAYGSPVSNQAGSLAPGLLNQLGEVKGMPSPGGGWPSYDTNWSGGATGVPTPLPPGPMPRDKGTGDPMGAPGGDPRMGRQPDPFLAQFNNANADLAKFYGPGIDGQFFRDSMNGMGAPGYNPWDMNPYAGRIGGNLPQQPLGQLLNFAMGNRPYQG